MNAPERYNALLKITENATILLLNTVLDKAFGRLVRRTRNHIRAENPVVPRNLLVLQELKMLIPAIRPDRVDQYDKLFQNLLSTSAGYGYDVAAITSEDFGDRQINTSVPIEATYAAAKQARGFLIKHGNTFAETSAEIIAQGIAEGRPTKEMIEDMRRRLGVTKSRAAMIVRTESLRAYNEAADQYYSELGVTHVSWYATSDDRVCEWCAPRAGLIYKRGEVSVPIPVSYTHLTLPTKQMG